MKRLFACVSTRTRLAIMVIGLSFLCSVIYSMPASADGFNLSYIGPASSNDRYNLTGDSSHPRTTLRIPVYFKYNPGIVGVDVFDVYHGKNASDGALFNGYYNKSGPGDGHFNIGGFYYESSTGMWRADVTAQLTKNYGQLVTSESSLYQFRLRLSNHDGIIAYAGGWASQANRQYDVKYLHGGSEAGGGGDQDEYLLMSLPCNITHDVQLGPGQPNELILFDLDQPGPLYPGSRSDKPYINRGLDINVSVYDETDGYEVVRYEGPKYNCDFNNQYDGSSCMGENGTLHVTMTMKPGHKYQVHIWRNWVDNLIEYHLPFDNISYATECDPKVDMRTTVDFTKKPTGDPKKPRTGYKQLLSYGKYNSKNNNKSIAEVLGHAGGQAHQLWTWEGNYPHVKGSLPKAVMDNNHHNAELYPGDVLTWWFRAYNSGDYIVPDAMKMDFTNLREGWIDSRPLGQSWNQTEPKPEEGSNWFRPADRGGPLNGSDHREIMWGCYDWGEKCYDNFWSFNRWISKGEAVARHYRYVVKSGDAGQTLCQWLRMSWDYNGWKQRLTPKACVYIPYHYPPPPNDKPKSGIVPTARVAGGKSKVQVGDTVTFDYRVENPTGPTKTRPFQYHNYTFILKRGTSLPADKDDRPTYPMSWYGDGVSCKGGRSLGQRWNNNPSLSAINPCVGWDTGEVNVVLNVGESRTSSKSYGIYGGSGWLAQPGDKICSYIAVDNNWSVKNDVSANTFRASNIACVVVTKSPNLNLSGSDSHAKDGFRGASVSESDKVTGTAKRGSYSQYGLLTGTDGVVNFGSAGYTTASDKYHSLACKLSYANTGSVQGDCKDLKGLLPAGLSKNPLSMPSKSASTGSLSSGNVTLNMLQSGSYYRSGNLAISDSILMPGRHITIFVDGDVTISGYIDTDWGTKYSKLSEIPSFTIKARNIKVEPWVALITGTYVATGHFESCKGAQNKSADLGMRLDSKCQQKLKVNGAIVSVGSPIFRRTFGAGNQPEDNQWDPNKISSTAEWINYTPNLWLTTSNGSSGNQLEGLTTTQVTNLPVRY